MKNLKIRNKTTSGAAYKSAVSKEGSACSEMAQSGEKEGEDLTESVSEMQQAIIDYNNSLFGNLRQ